MRQAASSAFIDPRISLQAATLPAAFGVADASVVIAYATGLSPEFWHVATLAIKAGLLLYFGLGKNVKVPSLHFIALCSIALLASTIAGRAELTPLLSAIGFIVHLTITGAVVDRDKLGPYLKAAGISIAAAAAAHIALAAIGKVPNFYGRYAYLGGNSPSLGAEINVAGALALSISARKKLFWPLVAVLAISTLMCQGRAAILAITAICAVYSAPKKINSQQLLLLIIALSLALLFITLRFESISDAISRILLLNDQYRGVTTGFTGRDARWHAALGAFEAHPFLGAGLSRFDEGGLLTPHNFFLYAISRHGVLGIAILISIASMYIAAARNAPQASMLILCITPLLVFNDRFMNTNPYPFLYFVILLALSKTERSDRQRNAPRLRLVYHKAR